MNSETYKNYLSDLGHLLKDLTLTRKADALAHRGLPEEDYYNGLVMGYIEILSLMQQQAEAFGIPLKDLRLEGFKPEKELL